ncbi:MAG: hypothetical protein NT002_14395 [candidate division Zixibacteria bacterium]|nr:hypothetical protein [candidate division Zixibacteria bacterium]
MKKRVKKQHHNPVRRKKGRVTDDTLVSEAMLRTAVSKILRRIKLDRTYDIPYLAGYSRSGKIIYIDRHLPKSFVTRGRRIFVDRYLILHETVEKALLDELGLHYQHAHQIALRAEEAGVRASRISWREYDRFMQRYIKVVGDEKLQRIPPELDIKPYHDEHDTKILVSMQKIVCRELAARRRRK